MNLKSISILFFCFPSFQNIFFFENLGFVDLKLVVDSVVVPHTFCYPSIRHNMSSITLLLPIDKPADIIMTMLENLSSKSPILPILKLSLIHSLTFLYYPDNTLMFIRFLVELALV